MSARSASEWTGRLRYYRVDLRRIRPYSSVMSTSQRCPQASDVHKPAMSTSQRCPRVSDAQPEAWARDTDRTTTSHLSLTRQARQLIDVEIQYKVQASDFIRRNSHSAAGIYQSIKKPTFFVGLMRFNQETTLNRRCVFFRCLIFRQTLCLGPSTS